MPSHDLPRPDWIRSITEPVRSIGVQPPSVPSVRPPTTLTARERVALRAYNNARIQTFAQKCQISLTVDGAYKNGTAYQDVLDDYLPARGKDFAKPSRVMRADIQSALEDDFVSKINREEISFAAMSRSEAAQQAVIDRVAARFEGRSRDVRIRANKPSYTLWKHRHGYDTRVGIRSGDLLDAVRNGTVKLRYRSA